MKLGPHAHNNMGIRTSSMGSHYPYIVVAMGDPNIPYHKPDGLCWRIRKPDGSYSSATWATSRGAEAQARLWRELDELDKGD